MENTLAMEYLSRDPLKHIVPLKVLQAHPREARAQYFSDASAGGVLLTLPTAASHYESTHYPQTRLVVLIASDTPALTAQMLAALPAGCGLVFKLTSAQDRAVVAERFPLQHIISFHSYTSAAGADFPASPGVSVSTRLDPCLLPLFGGNGYGQAELEEYFASEGTRSFALCRDGVPLSACFAHQNYGPVWEISGVHTAEAARRKGYARQVVETALHALIASGYSPRYQMHENNLASQTLAESIGLQRFLSTEHLLHLPA